MDESDKGLVSRFLKKKPIAGWVALDQASTTFRNYRVDGRPRTALIDKMGLMRGLIDPSHLTAADINQLIAGSLRLQQSPVDETARIGTESNAPLPLLQITIRPAMSVTGMSGGATRRQGNIWEYGVQASDSFWLTPTTYRACELFSPNRTKVLRTMFPSRFLTIAKRIVKLFSGNL